MPIKIPFLSDVTDFIRGTDNMADALDDVSDSLDDLAKDSTKAADKAGDKLGDGFKDGAKSAGKALDGVGDDLDGVAKDAKSLDTKVSDAFKNIATDAKTTGKKVEKELKDGAEGASEGMEQMSGDAQSNATEVAASFDGSAESIVDGMQGALAEMFSGFGPAGAAAGLAVALGIGLAVTKMQEGAEAATEFKQKAADMAGAISDAGGDISKVDIGGIIKEWGREVQADNWLTFWANESSTNFQDMAEKAKTSGVTAQDAIKGIKGTVDDSQGFLDGTTAEFERLTKEVQKNDLAMMNGGTTYNDAQRATMKQRDALKELREKAQDNITTTKDAIEIYGIEEEVLGDGTDAVKAKTDALLANADAMDKAAGRAMSADKAQLSYIDAVNQSTADIATNGKQTDINTEAGRANRQTLLDLADSANSLIGAQIEQGDSTANVTKQTDAARTAFIKAATEAGFGADEAGRLATQYGLVPKNVDTKVKAHGVQETKDAIDGVAAPRDVPIRFYPDTRPIEGALAQLNGRDIYVNVRGRGGQTIQ